MEYTNWNFLMIVLYQNILEINSVLIMRRDINAMDSISVKNILNDVSNSIVLDAIKTQNGISDCKNWDVIEIRLLLNDEVYKNFKSTRSEFDNNQFDLGYFLYDAFVTLSVDDVDNQQTYISSDTLYSEELIINQNEEPIFSGITTTFKTIDGLTIIVKDGLIVSIN
jgi:hypothetical protein